MAVAFLLTWRTCGTWLPGDERGWTSRSRNAPGEPHFDPDYRLENAAMGLMRAGPTGLGPTERSEIDAILREACEHRGWEILALNVRTNHVHLVVLTAKEPDRIVNALKARVARVLRDRGELPARRILWSRGLSKRVLIDDRALSTAVDYVLNRQ